MSHGFWKLLAFVLPERWMARVVRRRLRSFQADVEGAVTDKIAEVLLFAMELAFIFSKEYRRNLNGFRAQYVLATAEGRVAASALFEPGKMRVKTRAVPSPTVTVTFKSPAAFRRFLSSKEHDILESLLADEVAVDGNVTYVYKLGFMARALLLRLGLA